MKIAILVPADLPVPAVMGGAIETLINNFIDINEKQKSLEIHVFSEYNREAYRLSTQYRLSKFVFLKRGLLYNLLNLPFRVVRKLTGNKTLDLDIILIARRIRKLRIDKIIVEGSSHKLVELNKLIAREKLIFHMHSDLINTKTPKNIKIVNSASMILVASEFLSKQILQNSGGHCAPIKILRNGLKLELFAKSTVESQSNVRAKYLIPEGVPVILYVGRIVESKGILQLYLALKKIIDKKTFHFLIVGSFGSGFGFEKEAGEFTLKLRSYFKESKDWITLTGFIHNSDLPAIYSISSLLVVPSLCEDASPLVIIESLAAGTPLIITDGGGMTEYVTDDCAEIIKRNESMIDNLSLSILNLLGNHEKLQSMSRAAIRKSASYSVENYYKEFLQILLEEK